MEVLRPLIKEVLRSVLVPVMGEPVGEGGIDASTTTVTADTTMTTADNFRL